MNTQHLLIVFFFFDERAAAVLHAPPGLVARAKSRKECEEDQPSVAALGVRQILLSLLPRTRAALAATTIAPNVTSHEAPAGMEKW
jgi:hypothetical protein